MPPLKASDLRGHVDFAFITIRADEYDSVDKRYHCDEPVDGPRTLYGLATCQSESGVPYTVTLSRQLQEGQGEAQALAIETLQDLEPKYLVVVGIAGGVPTDEACLGDVIVPSMTQELCVVGATPKFTELDIRSFRLHRSAQKLVAGLSVMKARLGDWDQPDQIGPARPTIACPVERSRLYGNTRWKQRVQKSLERHFGGILRDHIQYLRSCPLHRLTRL